MLNRRTLGPAAAAALFIGLSTVRAETDGMSQVTAAVEKLRQLMLKPDRAELEALMSPDLTYGHSDRRVMNREEIIDSLMSGRSHFDDITLSAQTIKLVGDLAIVRHRFQADAVSNGIPSHPDIQILQVWQRTPARWTLLVRQAH